MNNVSFQDGVVFYECSANELIDVEIEDYVDELVFGEKIPCTVYNLLNVSKSFPQIRTIVIEEGVDKIQIWNRTFPNVKKVISYNKKFLSGNVLKGLGNSTGNEIILFNSFVKNECEAIDLSEVSCIESHAFEDCKSGNIINDDDVVNFCYDAFKDFHGIANLPRLEGGGHVLGHILMDYQYDIPDYIKTINNTADFSGKAIRISDASLLYNIKTACAPSRIELRGDKFNIIEIINVMRNFRLESLEILDDNPYLKTIDDILYTKDMRMLIKCSKNKSGRVKIPDGVEEIREDAFAYSNISEVIMPDSVKYIGERVFYGCRKLTHIRYSKNLTYIPKEAFSGCNTLDLSHLFDNVKNIGSRVAMISGLINIPDGVENIAEEAFCFNNKDEDSKVIIPPSVKTVGLRSFYGAKNITITTKNGILPKGFFKAIGYQVYSNNSYSAISVTVDGKTCMVPPDEENAMFDVYFEFYPFDPEIIYQHYADLETETRGDFLAFVYFNTKSIREREAAKKGLRKNSKEYINILYFRNKHHPEDRENKEKLIKFLSYGFASEEAVKNLICMIEEDKDTTLMAYAIDALKYYDLNDGFDI